MMIPVYSQLSCCLLLFICRTDCACCLCLQYSLFDCQNGRSLEVLRQSSISVKRVHVEAQYYIISILHLSAFREIVPIFLLPAFLAPKSLSSILFRFWRITYCSLKLNGLTKLTTILFGHCRSDLNFQQLYCLLTASIYTVQYVPILIRPTLSIYVCGHAHWTAQRVNCCCGLMPPGGTSTLDTFKVSRGSMVVRLTYFKFWSRIEHLQ